MPVRTDPDARVSLTVGPAIAAIATNTTVNGAGIDLSLTPNVRVMGVAFVGSRTDGTYTFAMEESVDNSVWTALVPTSGSIAAVSTANTSRVFSCQPVKRYVRMKVTSTAVTTGAVAGGMVLLLPAGQL